jgi:hypothetical protein
MATFTVNEEVKVKVNGRWYKGTVKALYGKGNGIVLQQTKSEKLIEISEITEKQSI